MMSQLQHGQRAADQSLPDQRQQEGLKLEKSKMTC